MMETKTAEKGRRLGMAALVIFMALTGVFAAAALLIFETPLFAYGADGSSDKTYVSVGLAYGGNAVKSCELYSDDGFQIVDIRDGMEETLPLLGYDHLVVTVENGIVTVSDSDETTLVTDLGADSVIMNGDYLGDGKIKTSVNQRQYRGGIQFYVRNQSQMNVINYLSLDHYLYGVLQGEMGYQNPKEALKAQAVAARSFAMANVSSHRSEGFDLCTNSHCQMYYGVSYEHSQTTEAVDDTSELVIYYKNRVVPAYYHKNSGGHTQNSEDVWSAKEGYLRGVKDSYCPKYPWTASFTWEQLSNQITGIGDIVNAFVSKRTDSENVLEMTFEGTRGTKTLSKENIRMSLGPSVVKSLNFEMEETVSETPSPCLELSILGADGVLKYGKKAAVRSVKDVRTLSSFDGLSVLSADGLRRLSTKTQKTASGEGITLRGLGYGHGVGMCQDSAILMAKDGWDFEEILSYFYTDIDVDYVSR